MKLENIIKTGVVLGGVALAAIGCSKNPVNNEDPATFNITPTCATTGDTLRVTSTNLKDDPDMYLVRWYINDVFSEWDYYEGNSLLPNKTKLGDNVTTALEYDSDAGEITVGYKSVIIQ